MMETLRELSRLWNRNYCLTTRISQIDANGKTMSVGRQTACSCRTILGHTNSHGSPIMDAKSTCRVGLGQESSSFTAANINLRQFEVGRVVRPLWVKHLGRN
jgi:hypothetical protein